MNSHGAVNRSERHCVKECQRVRPIGIFAKSQIIANDRLCQGEIGFHKTFALGWALGGAE